MKKLLIILSLLTGQVMAGPINDGIYKKVDSIVHSIFKHLEKKGEISDNGYFFSAVKYSRSPLKYEQKITNKRLLMRHVKKSLFTVFAYAELSEAQKTKAAKIFIKAIQKKFGNDFSFYKKVRGKSLGMMVLTDTCGVGGPDEQLYLKHKDTNTEAMILVSDVCD